MKNAHILQFPWNYTRYQSAIFIEHHSGSKVLTDVTLAHSVIRVGWVELVRKELLSFMELPSALPEQTLPTCHSHYLKPFAFRVAWTNMVRHFAASWSAPSATYLLGIYIIYPHDLPLMHSDQWWNYFNIVHQKHAEKKYNIIMWFSPDAKRYVQLSVVSSKRRMFPFQIVWIKFC